MSQVVERLMSAGTVLPSTTKAGRLFFLVDRQTPANSKLYASFSDNTWTEVGKIGGASVAGGHFIDDVDYSGFISDSNYFDLYLNNTDNGALISFFYNELNQSRFGVFIPHAGYFQFDCEFNGQTLVNVAAEVDPLRVDAGDLSGDYCNPLYRLTPINLNSNPSLKGGFELGLETNFHDNGIQSSHWFYLYDFYDNTTILVFNSLNQFLSIGKPTHFQDFLRVTGEAKFENVFGGDPILVADLPTPTTLAGRRHFVSDANATMTAGIGTIVVGNGSNKVPVYCDGTNWRIG